MIPTGLSALAVGLLGLTSTGAQYLAYIVANLTTLGSVILTGHIYFLNELVTPSIYLNSMPAMTFQSNGDITLGSGDIILNSSRNTEPCRIWGTDYYDCYKSVALTATGGNSNVGPTYYNVGSIQMPTSASGALEHVGLDCDGVPYAFKSDLGYVAATTSSGNQLWNDRAFASGAALIASGATIPVSIPKGYYIKLSTNTRVASSGQTSCRLWAKYHYQYNPS